LDIYDYSSEDAEQSYIVMEYIRGNNLREFLSQHKTVPPEAAALIGIGICEALACAHEHGIIHRDLKPENVMVSNHGDLKLMDFGIAHVIDAETMTQTGSLLGSPAHMAPEMIEGEKVDARADIFALGTVLYLLVTGRLPYDGSNAPQVLKKVLSGEHQPVEEAEPKVGREMSGIIETCMNHAPEDRFESVRDVIKALKAVVERVGYAEPREELRRFLLEPAGWTERFEECVVPTLTELGKAALEHGDVPRAIADFNRVLEYDPGNPEVERILKGLHQSRTLRNSLLGASAVAAVALLSWLAVIYWPVPTDPVVEAPPVAVEVEPPAVVRQPEEQPTLQHREDTEQLGKRAAEDLLRIAQEIAQRPRFTVAEVRHVPMPAIITRPTEEKTIEEPAEVRPTVYPYRFRLSPPAAQLTILGRTYSSLEAARGIDLPPGKYVVSASSRGCKSLRTSILVDGPQADRHDIVLNWEDGTVNVSSDVDAVLYLGEDTRNVARRLQARVPSTFRFPFGDADQENSMSVTFHIAPTNDMTRRKSHTVTVRPGMAETLNVAFGRN
jgi:serine/threonine-protein kinase